MDGFNRIPSCVDAAAVTENRPSVRERARKEETIILTAAIAALRADDWIPLCQLPA